jgi:hypothetical protein
LEKLIPYLIGGLWQAHDALSPMGLIARVTDQYQKINENTAASAEELSSIIREVKSLDLRILETGRLSLTLSQEQLLVLIGNYLTKKYARNGATSGSIMIETESGGHEQGSQAILSLPNRAIYVRLCENALGQEALEHELAEAKSRNPSETWIVSYLGSQKADYLLEPVFLAENLILRGHFRVMTVSDLLSEITQRRFVASLEEFVKKESTSKSSARFILSRIA